MKINQLPLGSGFTRANRRGSVRRIGEGSVTVSLLAEKTVQPDEDGNPETVILHKAETTTWSPATEVVADSTYDQPLTETEDM